MSRGSLVRLAIVVYAILALALVLRLVLARVRPAGFAPEDNEAHDKEMVER